MKTIKITLKIPDEFYDLFLAELEKNAMVPLWYERQFSDVTRTLEEFQAVKTEHN